MAGAIGISRYFLSLLVGAFVVWIVNLIGGRILGGARNTSVTGPYADGTEWLTAAQDFLPIVFLFVGLFGILAYSVWVREIRR